MTGKDISIRLKNESAKHETIKLIHEVMECLNGGVVAFTVDSNHKVDFLFANDSFLRMIGDTREHFYLHECKIYEMIYPEDRNRVVQRTLQASLDSKPFNITYRMCIPGKDIIWWESRVAVKKVTGVSLPVWVVTINDITPKVEAEDEKRIHVEEMKIAIEQMGKIICEYDVKACTLRIPQTYAKWYGFPTLLQDVPYVAKKTNILAKESIEPYIWFYKEIQRGVKSDSIDVRIRRLDGTWHWERFEFKTIFDDEGMPVKAIVVIEDITYQRETKEGFEREYRLRKELIKDALLYYKVNLSSGIIEEYSSKLDDIPSMFVSVKISDELHRDMLANVVPEYHDIVSNSLFSNALIEHYQRGESTLLLEYKRMMPDGDIRWVRATGNILQRRENDELIAFVHVHDYDLEKKKQLTFEAVISQQMEAFSITNVKTRKTKLTYIKPDIVSTDKFYEKDYDEHIMERAESCVMPEDRNRFIDKLRFDNLIEAMKKTGREEFTYRLRGHDGTILQKHTTAFYLDDTREDIILCRSDITAIYKEEQQQKLELQKAVARANKANEAKDEFLSRMSHDMRTPLNAILALSSEEMLYQSTDEEREQWLADIHCSGEYLRGLINDVLDVSLIGARNLRLDPEPFLITDFQHVVETAIGAMCDEKNIHFHFDCKYIEYPWILTDRTRFNQIFINLLSNAVKYTPDGGRIDFEIETIGYENGQPIKQFVVRDNGIGMSSEFLPHAFESFTQERQQSSDKNNQGAGLGLSIVKRIIEMMDGTITVKSKLGKGTEFTVILPLNRADPVEDTEVDEKILQKLQGKRILICEDHALNAKITGVLLAKRGCLTEWADNGKRALYMFANSEVGYYDAILMDIRMPIMDGWEATAAIRELKRSDAQTISIIAVTADAFSADECTTSARGMNGYLCKPIDTMLMYELIATEIS